MTDDVEIRQDCHLDTAMSSVNHGGAPNSAEDAMDFARMRLQALRILPADNLDVAADTGIAAAWSRAEPGRGCSRRQRNLEIIRPPRLDAASAAKSAQRAWRNHRWHAASEDPLACSDFEQTQSAPLATNGNDSILAKPINYDSENCARRISPDWRSGATREQVLMRLSPSSCGISSTPE